MPTVVNLKYLCSTSPSTLFDLLHRFTVNGNESELYALSLPANSAFLARRDKRGIVRAERLVSICGKQIFVLADISSSDVAGAVHGP